MTLLIKNVKQLGNAKQRPCWGFFCLFFKEMEQSLLSTQLSCVFPSFILSKALGK